jgi:hypothetical protein
MNHHENSIGVIVNFSENSQKSRFTTGINDTRGKFATGVNDRGGKFCYQYRLCCLPAVATTPVANCHRYQRHCVNFAIGVTDTSGK